jgi:hypothetical protein
MGEKQSPPFDLDCHVDKQCESSDRVGNVNVGGGGLPLRVAFVV